MAQERVQAAAAGWKRVDGSTWYPPYDGAMPGTKRMITLKPSKTGTPILVDRYGKTTGSYVSPAGMSLESRAMNYVPDTPASVYSVEKAIPGVERATVTPWFGQKGLGVQYRMPETVKELLNDKFIKEVK